MNTTAKRESAALGLRLPVGLDPILVESLIGELLSLLRGCFPDPTPGALDTLREPSYGLFGLRRLWWRDRVKRAVAQAWRGPRAVLPEVQDAVLERLRAGVSAATLAGLYGRQG